MVTMQGIDGDEILVSHIEVWYEHGIDWCADMMDGNGDYIDATADYSPTRKLAIERSRILFPNIDIQVFSKGERNLLWTIQGDMLEANTCPECDRELEQDSRKCPDCTAADYQD
jgi:hypothetical protein